MKAIVFLGNPGTKYQNTRHNVAWLFADYLTQAWQCPDAFAAKPKFYAEVLSCTMAGEQLFLVKPTTFMNRSGQAVLAVKQFYRFDESDLLIIHDDKDLSFGSIRLRTDSGSGGHNGMQDIIDRLGTKSIPRLKIGVDSQLRTEQGIDTATFVLSAFSSQEMAELASTVFPEVLARTQTWLTTHAE